MIPVSQLGLELPLIPKSPHQGRSSFKNAQKAWSVNCLFWFVFFLNPSRGVCLSSAATLEQEPAHRPASCAALAFPSSCTVQPPGLCRRTTAEKRLAKQQNPRAETSFGERDTQPLPKLLCGYRCTFCSASEVNIFLTEQRWASLLIGFGKLGYSAFFHTLHFYICPKWGCAASSGLQYLRRMNTGSGQILLSWRRGCIQVQP